MYSLTVIFVLFVIVNRIISHLLVIGESAHDRRVHNAVEKHREGVDGKRGVIEVTLNHVVDLLIGHLHGLHGVLQRTDLFLQRKNKKTVSNTPTQTANLKCYYFQATSNNNGWVFMRTIISKLDTL